MNTDSKAVMGKDDHQIVERYLRNELSDIETEKFEQRLLWDTEIQSQLELTQRLREGMRDVAVGESASDVGSWTGIFKSPRYAAAASVLLAVTSLGWLMTWLNSGVDDRASLSQVASTRVYSLDTMRGQPDPDDLPLVTPGAATEWLTLLVYPDLGGYLQLRAELYRQSDSPDNNLDEYRPWQSIWQGVPTTTGTGDAVAVLVQSALLEPGFYRLRVNGWENNRPSEIIGEVFFRVPGQ